MTAALPHRCIPSQKGSSSMSAGPQIVFVRFLTSHSPKLEPWVAHTGRVVGVASRSKNSRDSTEGIVVWQLVSANNRQLARSIEVHDTFEDARASVTEVVAAGKELTVEMVSESGRGVYGWYASLKGKPVATCARWYVTDRDRRHSIELAMRSISLATLHPGARLADPALMTGDRDHVL